MKEYSDGDIYENEDGEFWAEVALYPDPAVVGQGYADSRGLIVFQEGGIEPIQLRECECDEPKPSCPDDAEGKPCRFREDVPCWQFYSTDDPEQNGDPVWFPHDKAGRTLILGHAYDDYHRGRGPLEYGCHATEQEHYAERLEAPGQIALTDLIR
jgi:hypothetical protein